jgi:apolipoprotein D and lipocalin family protein
VIALDTDYTWAMVCGNTRDYLWILARKPNLEEGVRQDLIEKAKNMGFDTDKLIIVEQ